MKILFYLPVITPWWFDHIVAPLAGRLAQEHEVHILAPPPWSGTGIGQRELDAQMPVQWHLFDADSHPSMRTGATERARIVDVVATLAPDYVLCRSADAEITRDFPGTVRHIMEGGAAPLSLPPHWVVLQDDLFDHGLVPDIDSAARAELDRLIAPAWSALQARARPSRQMRKAFAKWAELPSDRPILALPLEYEHEENFFPIHRVGAAPNHRLIAELAERIDDRFFLAITNHPLNELYVDSGAVEAEIASHGPRMRLLPSKGPDGEGTTALLARDADGMLVGDSKVFAMAGFYGTPMLRRTKFKTGGWLNAYHDLDEFLSAVAAGTARKPDQDAARTWFAFHVANNVLDPQDPALTAADILARLDRPVDPARWDRNFAHFRTTVG